MAPYCKLYRNNCCCPRNDSVIHLDIDFQSNSPSIVLRSRGVLANGAVCGLPQNGTDETKVIISILTFGNTWAQGEVKTLGNLKVTFLRDAAGEIYIPTFDPECSVTIGTSSGANIGIIIGAVVGSVVGAALLVIAAFIIYKRCSKRAQYRDVAGL